MTKELGKLLAGFPKKNPLVDATVAVPIETEWVVAASICIFNVWVVRSTHTTNMCQLKSAIAKLAGVNPNPVNVIMVLVPVPLFVNCHPIVPFGDPYENTLEEWLAGTPVGKVIQITVAHSDKPDGLYPLLVVLQPTVCSADTLPFGPGNAPLPTTKVQLLLASQSF